MLAGFGFVVVLSLFALLLRVIWNLRGWFMAREFVWLECMETGLRNYRVIKETRGTERLELKKYNKKLRKHTSHKESRKK